VQKVHKVILWQCPFLMVSAGLCVIEGICSFATFNYRFGQRVLNNIGISFYFFIGPHAFVEQHYICYSLEGICNNQLSLIHISPTHLMGK
jgi:hypothetical protein